MEHDLSQPVKAVDVSDIESYRAAETVEDAEKTFPQSVASGDPSPSGAILWTRVSPSAYSEDTSLIVEVAEDRSFAEGVQSNVVEAKEISPAHDYTVKVDLDESDFELDSNRWYHYRFEYDGVTSQIGRFRTLPSVESTPEAVRFAVVSCQNYLNGYFGAYHHIAEEDVHFVLDLGDFIYEYATQKEGRKNYPGRDIELPSDSEVATCLEDYRHLYRTYHSDPFLRDALERHTRIFTWDDHEFANDIYWDHTHGTPRAPGHPADEESEELITRLVRDALKAWWEYTPTRATYDPDADRVNEILTIYRTFRFGDLLTIVVTDERLFRTRPTANCAETRLPDWVEELALERIPFCYVNKNPTDTMLGEEQREWFLNEIRDQETVWTAWANEVLTLPVRVGVGPFSVDPSNQAWDGYESEREELMYKIKYADVENFVTLTGDMHSYLVGYQRLDYRSWIQDLVTVPDPRTERSRRVGVELMTPAITSVNIAEKFGENFVERVPDRFARRFPRLVEVGRNAYGDVMEAIFTGGARLFMPHIESFNSHEWGYSVVEFTPDACTHRAYSVDKTVNSSTAEKRLINAVRIPVQEPGRPLTIRG